MTTDHDLRHTIRTELAQTESDLLQRVSAEVQSWAIQIIMVTSSIHLMIVALFHRD